MKPQFEFDKYSIGVEDIKTEAEQALRMAFSQIDKMVPKKIFHKNKAARLKSHLNTSLKKLAG